MTTLKPVLRAMGWTRGEEQRAAIKLLQASGALGMPPEPLMDDHTADTLLDQADFPSGKEAAEWMADMVYAHREHPAMEVLNERMLERGPTLLARVAIEEQVREVTDGLSVLNPAIIKTDAQSYQFRKDGDAKGVTESGRQMDTEWNDFKHGDPLLVHQRKDGTMYIVDGHHRLDFAQRLNKEGKGPQWVAAKIIREEDGYTVKDAKLIGAFVNMAKGHATAVEGALALKEAQGADVHKNLLPHLDERDLKRGNMPASQALAKLSDESLAMIERKEVPVEAAVVVAEKVQDGAQQTRTMSTIRSILEERGSKAVVESAVARVLADRQKAAAVEPKSI